MAVRKWIFAGELAMALSLAAGASARTGHFDSLPFEEDRAPALHSLWADMDAEADTLWGELASEVEKQRAYYFAPTGPADKGWAERGVDMAALLALAPGGDAANVLYSDDGEGPVLQALNAAAMMELVKEWAPVTERRFALEGSGAFVSMLALTPAHMLVSREAWEKTGNGYCPKSRTPGPADHMAVYRDSRLPYDAASEQDREMEGTAFSAWTALSRTVTPRVCWIYVQVAPGVYETRSFDAEGRPLGHMDEGTKKLRIVRVAELGKMLAGRMQSMASASAR